MKQIVIIVVQCDKNYAVLMCAPPVAPYVSILALTYVDTSAILERSTWHNSP